MVDAGAIKERLNAVRSRIAAAAKKSGRNASDITLVAVSKFHPFEALSIALSIGRSENFPIVFGENYVQEFEEKMQQLGEQVNCHLIGHLQRNKAKKAVELFSVIESVDSVELLIALNKAAGKIGKIQDIYLQVNISSDPKKSGFSTAEIARVINEQIGGLHNLKLLGLMTITELYENPEEARKDFIALREIRDRLSPQSHKLGLSMGMSQDFEIAIEEGATVVRVGTAIFGERSN